MAAVVSGVSAIGMASQAQAQDRFSVDVSAEGGVARNPFLQSGDSPVVGSGTLEVRPVLEWDQPLTKLRLDGDALVTGYTNRYRVNDSFSAHANGERQISDSSAITGELGYVNSILGSFNDASVPISTVNSPATTPSSVVGTVPVSTVYLPTNLPTFVNDVALGQIGSRLSVYEGAAGFSTRLSQVDQLSLNFSASAVRYGGGGLLQSDYNYYDPSITYSRTLGRDFSVSAGVSVGISNYLGTRLGDATIIQPNVSVSRRLASNWVLQAGVGVSIARLSEPVGTRTSTSFAGSLSACRQDTRFNVCVTASRQAVPSSVLGIRNQTSLGANAGYRVSPRDDVSFSFSYTNASSPLLGQVANVPFNSSVDYVAADATYNRRLGERLSGFVSGGVNKAFDSVNNRSAGLEARVGVRYRFGTAQ